jgi:hypothetical protein
LVHFNNSFCCPKKIAVAGSNKGAQLLAIVIDVLSELLLQLSHRRQWMLERIFPRVQGSWIRYSACHWQRLLLEKIN